eukprot:CAMPEP_0204836474 /NCGR_PEP_ID=MMETSP1346-20131115/25249_1 /ASSEMBLY_ACC=CAM_ASM_000771 /TAXON_ID=215587 /ORGANISM="Aplanochytrium stocchinoi, Strain GSBS06" /LENGTH=78 /DNA_ID=CAMNT_0051971215 /DNA_START=72 /DNA_END=305 /DNA_ORIENTATION=-
MSKENDFGGKDGKENASFTSNCSGTSITNSNNNTTMTGNNNDMSIKVVGNGSGIKDKELKNNAIVQVEQPLLQSTLNL